jgi:hypothetical protein
VSPNNTCTHGDLDPAYAAMAADERREAEARDWGDEAAIVELRVQPAKRVRERRPGRRTRSPRRIRITQ